MQETAKTQLAQKERELLLATSELASVTKELKALKVRELELRDSLGRANAEDLGLSAQVAVLTHKSDLLAQELADSKASWAVERISLRADATHHEGVEASASLEVERLRGGASRGKASDGGSKATAALTRESGSFARVRHEHDDGYSSRGRGNSTRRLSDG